jgi:hypothetical protein
MAGRVGYGANQSGHAANWVQVWGLSVVVMRGRGRCSTAEVWAHLKHVELLVVVAVVAARGQHAHSARVQVVTAAAPPCQHATAVRTAGAV